MGNLVLSTELKRELATVKSLEANTGKMQTVIKFYSAHPMLETLTAGGTEAPKAKCMK